MRSFVISILVIIALTANTLYSQVTFVSPVAEKNQGYRIALNGDSIPIILKVKLELFSQEPVFFNYSDGLKYTDLEGKKGKMTPENSKEFGFIIDGKVTRFKSVFQFFPWSPIAIRMFLKLEIDDYLKLYSLITRSSPMNGRVMGPPIISTSYYLQKGDESLFEWSFGSFKDDMSNYLKEDTELVGKIQNRDLKAKDIQTIVQEYNRWYKYERNNK